MQDKSDLIFSNGSTSEAAAMTGQHLHSEYVRIPTVPCMAVENEKDFADLNDYITHFLYLHSLAMRANIIS